MSVELAPWLRRRRPTRIVCQPSGKEWPRPATRPWSQLVDLAGDSESVEAYQDAALLGVWRRPSSPQAGAPSRGGKESAGGAVGAAPSPGAETFLRMELDGLREIVRMQQGMLREVVASQMLALRSVRAAAGAAPPVEEEDDDDELESLLRNVLVSKVGAGAADGQSTQKILASVLAGAAK